MAAPMFSVIIPTYNRLERLKRAIASVEAQTYGDYELLVVDDASTDGTLDYLTSLSAEVKVLQQAQNLGVSATRNRAIGVAAAPWLAFLDSDDEWLPTKLEQCSGFIQASPEVKLFQTEEIWLRHGQRIYPKAYHKKRAGWIFIPMLERCLVSPSAAVVHKSVFQNVGLFDEELPACEDYDFWLRANVRYPIELLDDPLTLKHGGHEDQLSRAWGLDRFRIQSLVKIRESVALPNDAFNALNQVLLRKIAIYRNGLKKRGKLRELAAVESLLR